MKKSILSLAALSFLAVGCDKEPEITTGTFTVWTDSDSGCGYITVDVDGKTADITKYHATNEVDCGESGTATFTLEEGQYTYTAKDDCGTTWTDVVEIKSEKCLTLELIN